MRHVDGPRRRPNCGGHLGWGICLESRSPGVRSPGASRDSPTPHRWRSSYGQYCCEAVDITRTATGRSAAVLRPLAGHRGRRPTSTKPRGSQPRGFPGFADPSQVAVQPRTILLRSGGHYQDSDWNISGRSLVSSFSPSVETKVLSHPSLSREFLSFHLSMAQFGAGPHARRLP